MKEYFNFNDEVLDVADFLELDTSYHTLKTKLAKFSNIFKLFDEEHKKSHDELLILRDEGINKFRENSSKNSLALWNNINEAQTFLHLVKAANLALTI